MKQDEKKGYEDVVKRLDALIRINLRLSQVQEMTARDQINLLNTVGLSYSEIARILGRSEGYVASELSLNKKRKGGKTWRQNF